MARPRRRNQTRPPATSTPHDSLPVALSRRLIFRRKSHVLIFNRLFIFPARSPQFNVWAQFWSECPETFLADAPEDGEENGNDGMWYKYLLFIVLFGLRVSVKRNPGGPFVVYREFHETGAAASMSMDFF